MKQRRDPSGGTHAPLPAREEDDIPTDFVLGLIAVTLVACLVAIALAWLHGA
jgi:hypothetical protein